MQRQGIFDRTAGALVVIAVRCVGGRDIATIYWAERRLALAVTGYASKAELLAVARSVHGQMDLLRQP